MSAEQPYIERSLTQILLQATSDFPVVVLTGPRQSGKTTLLKHLFGDRYGYVSLEGPDIKLSATEDPRGFLKHHPAPVIFDEVQHAPGLLPYIKELVDSRRGIAGQYLLTGSQNLLLLQSITESLAGRVAVLKLFPLSRRESLAEPRRMLPWEATPVLGPPGTHAENTIWSEFLRGSFPELAANPARDSRLWYAGYVQTYLERDLRILRHVGDLTQFQLFLRALASRNAQLLVLSDLARDLGVAVNTVKAWLSVLEATYQVLVVRPYYRNANKRLVKIPKVYFTDLGILCYLTGLRDPIHAASGPMRGSLMETAVLSEIWKTYAHRGEEPRIWFWRTSAGMEVDFIVETERGPVPVEVKATATPLPAHASSIRAFAALFPGETRPGYVIHSGDIQLPLGDDVVALPYTAL